MSGGDRPRVMMVVRLFHPWVGGTERQAHKLARELIRRGMNVQVATGWWFRGTPQSDLIDGVPVFRHHTLWEFFGIKGLRKFGGYLYILTLVRHLWRQRSSFDVIHVHGFNYHTAAAVVAGRMLGKPVVVKLANSGPASDILRMREGRQLALSRLMLPTALRSDRFVALNRAVVDELRAAGVDDARIVEIPNGVDPRPAGDSPTGDGRLRLVYVGRLHPQKGVDCLLRGIALLRRDHPDLPVELRLVGDGPDRDRLQRLSGQLGVSEQVRFLGVQDDVAAELQRADVFVLTSRAEGLSNALLEAMAQGLPVVVSDVPGNTDVVEDGVNGLLVEADRPDRLARQLHRLLSVASLRHRLGREARRTIESRYTIGATADSYLTLYRQLHSPSRPLPSPTTEEAHP